MATQPQEDALGEEEAKDLEVLRRVLFSLMLPTTRVASTQEFPLKELTTLLRLAYFRQLRGRTVELEATRPSDARLKVAQHGTEHPSAIGPARGRRG